VHHAGDPHALVGGQAGGLAEHAEHDQSDGAAAEQVGDLTAEQPLVDAGGVSGERRGEHAPQPAG
jgi:hypothetical protein